MIEVGEYVRTKNGEIHKIIEIIDRYDELYRYYRFENDMGTYEEYILKHSKNIIDLIEVGDIVEVLLNLDTKATQKYEILSQEMIDEVKKDITSVEYLVSILTKEQYNANCFRLEETK